MKYYVIELQTHYDGTAGNLVFAYDSRADAEEKYHAILMYASKPHEGSDVTIHAAILMNSKAEPIKNEFYTHPYTPPEPEQEAE